MARLRGDWHERQLARTTVTPRWHRLRLQVRASLSRVLSVFENPSRSLAVALPYGSQAPGPVTAGEPARPSGDPGSARWATQQRLVAGGVATLVLVASVIGVSPVHGPAGGTGNVLGAGAAPRIAVGGGPSPLDGAPGANSGQAGAGGPEVDNAFPLDTSLAAVGQQPVGAPAESGVDGPDIEAFSDNPGSEPDGLQPLVEFPASDPTESTDQGPYLADGTILKPIAVNTSVPDARELLTTYKVRKGDTLTSIAHHFGLSLVTLYWANHLTTKLNSKTDLKVGRVLSIPPVNGVLHVVTDRETLEDISKRTGVAVQKIVNANGLEQPTVFVGQWIIVPGAKAKPIPVAAPKPKPVTRSTASASSSRPAPKPTTRRTYSARWAWPAPGGHISQYYHYGHWGLDIAADYGAPVLAARSGVVIFAGWKNNGGGWQVWISHPGGMFSTYNHMSALSVGTGQSVGGGQRVGRIGRSGHATGPHLHFEVWVGSIWNGGYRSNPLRWI